MDLVRLVRIPVDKVEYQKVSGDPGDHHEDERHELEYGIFMMEDHECPHGDHEYVVCKIQHKAYCDPVAERALGEGLREVVQEAVFQRVSALYRRSRLKNVRMLQKYRYPKATKRFARSQ